MYVCLCKGITDGDIKRSMDEGAGSFREVRERLGVSTVCGSCACVAKELVKANTKYTQNHPNALFFSAS